MQGEVRKFDEMRILMKASKQRSNSLLTQYNQVQWQYKTNSGVSGVGYTVYCDGYVIRTKIFGRPGFFWVYSETVSARHSSPKTALHGSVS